MDVNGHVPALRLFALLARWASTCRGSIPHVPARRVSPSGARGALHHCVCTVVHVAALELGGEYILNLPL
eukprot:scaffold248944_cov31-Tisochrysis_lutea.AAC.1